MKRDLSELNKLERYLMKRGMIYVRDDDETVPLIDRHQIRVYKNGIKIWDVICQADSYGGSKGLLEVAGELVRSPNVKTEGDLTADEIIKRIEENGNGQKS